MMIKWYWSYFCAKYTQKKLIVDKYPYRFSNLSLLSIEWLKISTLPSYSRLFTPHPFTHNSLSDMTGGDECKCRIFVALSGCNIVLESLQNGNHYGYNSVS